MLNMFSVIQQKCLLLYYIFWHLIYEFFALNFNTSIAICNYCFLAYCPENFFEEVDVDGKLLKLCWQIFPSEYKTYDEAIKACQSKSPTGRLIILDTAEKQTRVRQRLMSVLSQVYK